MNYFIVIWNLVHFANRNNGRTGKLKCFKFISMFIIVVGLYNVQRISVLLQHFPLVCYRRKFIDIGRTKVDEEQFNNNWKPKDVFQVVIFIMTEESQYVYLLELLSIEWA